jgi:hypothetical protein
MLAAFALLFGVAVVIGQAQGAQADTVLFTATTQISNDGATGGYFPADYPTYGIWAYDGQSISGGSDPFTRTLTVSHTNFSTCEDNPATSGIDTSTDTCYTATISDSGPFRTVVNADQPNQGSTDTGDATGDTISHTVAGTFTGTASYIFYAPDSTPANADYVSATLDDSDTADNALGTTSNRTYAWYEQAFPAHSGATGVQLNDWTWTYSTGCESWTDAYGDGNESTGIDSYGESTPLSTFGEITGLLCPAPGPSPSPTASTPPPSTSNYGDEVNPFGNGFDVFKQHFAPGGIIAGWPATQADPATHFDRNAEGPDWQFQAAGTGLCVSDPGGGWPSDPLPDGLILTVCNGGNWQKFAPGAGGILTDVATGLIVSPDGTGGQLRGTAGPVSWGGSAYAWVPFASLP